MTLPVFFAVCAGGAFGAMLRALVTHLGNRRAPWGTLAVNWIGSALIGVFIAMGQDWPLWIQGLLLTGLCGALTTFSTVMVEAAKWWRGGLVLRALAYLALTFGGSIGLILLAVKFVPVLA